MTNYVFVLDADKRPLAPCHPARARELLRKQKAAVFRKQPFTIILKYVPEGPVNTDYEVRIDPGSKKTGVAVISKGKRGDRCVIGFNLEHRGETIRDKLTRRAACRRARRSRNLRYRKPRFLNRTKPKGWLPPSIFHRVLTTQTWIDRIMRWSTVSSSRVEIVKFDTQKLRNPDISGKEYQKGKLFGTELREYLLEAFDRTCQYCKGSSGDKILQWEHIIPRSKGGSDALDNATLACKHCNRMKDNKSLDRWLLEIKDRKGKYYEALRRNIPRVKKGLKPSLRDAAVMNAVRYRLIDYLEALGLNPQAYPGWKTKRNRLDQKYSKDHWVDAACVGEAGEEVFVHPRHRAMTFKACGHGSRQMCKVDKYGFPRSKPKGLSRVFGFKTGDLVKARIPRGKYEGTHVGRVVVKTRGQFTINKNATAAFVYFTKLQATDGYRYAYGTRETTVIVKKDQKLRDIMGYLGILYRVVKKTVKDDKGFFMISC